ncbi:hypothetical protein LCGC14_2959360 [marine sediment metagenome]|uniref:Uncharacterized protein n=1 Tax=marine sediment metagenome TaxID=412755 RepID=A0A0F8ZKJ0_9ZZZZ
MTDEVFQLMEEACHGTRFTEQQITDYCEKVLNLHLSSRPEGKLLFDGVQIIRQLQSELAHTGMEKMELTHQRQGPEGQ